MKNPLLSIKGTVKSAFYHYSTIVISIIPCIIVGSLAEAVVNLLTRMPLYQGAALAQTWPWLGQIGQIMGIVSSCGILMIPVYITWAAVKHFQGTELLGIFVGLCLVPASLMSGLAWPEAVLEGTAVYFQLGDWLIPKAGFQGQMLVGILSGLVLVKLEKALTRIVPECLRIFLVPLTSVVSTVFLTYLVIGPLARLLEKAMVAAVEFVLLRPELKYLGGWIMGLIQLPMMLFGIHLALVSVNLQMVMSGGGSPLWAITVSSVLAAGAASLAVMLFGDREMKKPAREGAVITLGLGTVEPALFGVCIQEKPAFVGAVLASGIAGYLSRLLECNANVFGINGFFSFLSFPMELWARYALVLAAAVAGGFVFTSLGIWLKKSRAKRK